MARELTELDKRVLEIAITNPAIFVEMLGKETMDRLKVCLLRGDGKSYGAISQRLSITVRQAEYGCGKCEVKNA